MYTEDVTVDALNWILDRICMRLELPQSYRDLAEEHYNAIGNWLAAENSPLVNFRPTIYPQGSLRIGTTVKPIKYDEYDLDLVCELDINPYRIRPNVLLNMVYERIISNEIYRSITNKKKRCIRIDYAGQFHLDILPACPDADTCSTCVVVPDREMNQGHGGWSASNPKGFADWFEKVAAQYYLVLEKKEIEPLPDAESNDHKPPLKRSVQLLKRWRDLAFQDEEDFSPPSIVLTTLSAQIYRNELTLADTFTALIDGLVLLMTNTQGPLRVYNPANRDELLSEKWQEIPEAYEIFKDKMLSLQIAWRVLLELQGPDAAQKLQSLFGENIVKTAYKDFAEQKISAMRDDGNLGMDSATGLLGVAPSYVPVRKNTFHGSVL